MKECHKACTTASLNAVKIACKLVMLWLDFFENSNATTLNQRSICKAKHFFPEILRKSKFRFYGVLKDGQNSILLIRRLLTMNCIEARSFTVSRM